MARATDGATVLYVDPEDEIADLATDALAEHGVRVVRARDADSARERLDGGGIDGVVSRQGLPGESGVDLLRSVRERDPDLPFVLFAHDGDEHLASEAIAAGVSEYVPTRRGDRRFASLASAVERALATNEEYRDVDEELKDQAMDAAPVGITIADATAPDVPMVYINDSFEEMTGYDRADTLGRNCRFLQGPRSDTDAVRQMREAIEREEEVSVELVNYTADGDPFWNRVDIAPIEREGEVTHFVGFQTDVTERVEAEREATRAAARAERERETVESLLAQLDGLVTDVTTAMLEARTRPGAAATLCERLVDTAQYFLAGVADIDPGSDVARVTTTAGPSDDIAGATVPLDGDGPVARAVADGEAVFATPPTDGWEWFGPAAADRSLGAIPLRYGEATYGVLLVVAEDDGFDEHERGILGAVGRIAATALNAIATQRRLTSDEVVELEFSLSGTDPFVVGLSADLNCAFEHVGTVTADDGTTSLYFEVTGTEYETLAAAVDERDLGVTCTPITTGENRTVVEFAVEGTPLVTILRDHGGSLQSLSAESGTGRLLVDIDPEAEPRRVVDAIEAGLPGADLTAYRERERPVRTRGDVLADIEDSLTDRQETALRKAYVGGFFEWPRDTTGEELAESMGIDRSTFHQHFRVAQRKVLDTLYDA